MKIDLMKLKKEEVFEVSKSTSYSLNPSHLKNVSLEKEIFFNFKTSNTSTKIKYTCVAQENTNLSLKIVLYSEKKNIKNLEAYLEIYVLNLSKNNVIRVKPFLEIPQKEIRFEHKVTIGAPNPKWIKYLNSRGIPHNKSVKLIAQGFITG